LLSKKQKSVAKGAGEARSKAGRRAGGRGGSAPATRDAGPVDVHVDAGGQLSRRKADACGDESNRRHDPMYAREREKYAEPIPSRELILDTLRDLGRPAHPAEIEKLLDIRRHEQEPFARRLAAMERDGQLLLNRKGQLCIVEKLDLITGRVDGHPDGFGFLVRDDKGADVFLSPREMHKVLHGDRVAVRQTGTDRRGRPEGTIVEVLERANTTVVGRLHEDKGVWFVIAENRRISQDLLVPPSGLGRGRNRASAGQVVVAEIVDPPSEQRQPIARVVEVLGNHTDPGMEIEIALRKYDLPHEFSKPAKKDAARLPEGVHEADLAGRIDLRDLPLVTIDGETARDFDDAVWCERKGKGFRLLVAIADVSHYVRDGAPLDRDALDRGTSVYFPRRVIPMLPEALSNGLCSLNPDVDRLCMACDMTIGATGTVRDYRFYPGVMHSHARLTYTEVWQRLSEGPGDDARARALQPRIEDLYALYKVLSRARARRGAIDFDTAEMELRFDQYGKIETIVPSVRNDAHRIIEECMLAANVSAADFLAASEHPALYRVHEGPSPEKLESLREFLASSALSLGGGDEPSPADYARLLERIKGRPDFDLLQTVLLRSLKQAMYAPDNVGHFGLAYDAYTHFTSPIRRYPDLLVHRAIKAALAGERYRPRTGWAELGAHCSMTERRADEASREVENWLKCYFMQDRIGESFVGTISGVTHFGVFVTLDEVFVDGLVHITELGSDYFRYEANQHKLTGERTGRVFRLADRIRVTVVRVDLEQSKIDFVLAADETVGGTAPERAPSRPQSAGARGPEGGAKGRRA
jgi:ribonuclease R